MADPVRIVRIETLGAEVEGIRAEAARQGHAFVARWLDEWASGANRFDRPGELFLGAWAGSSLVGVGGLNRDRDPSGRDAGRIRHLYVLAAGRRQGVGTLLLSRLVAAAGPSFPRLRVRAGTAAAGAFYGARGFAPTGEDGATHALALVYGPERYRPPR